MPTNIASGQLTETPAGTPHRDRPPPHLAVVAHDVGDAGPQA
jgi:hypothetical protein